MDTRTTILEHLLAIRGILDRQAEDLREIKERLGVVGVGTGGLAGRYASLATRLDRIDDRLAKVEKRLDLLDA
jgi:hypothetical protein